MCSLLHRVPRKIFIFKCCQYPQRVAHNVTKPVTHFSLLHNTLLNMQKGSFCNINTFNDFIFCLTKAAGCAKKLAEVPLLIMFSSSIPPVAHANLSKQSLWNKFTFHIFFVFYLFICYLCQHCSTGIIILYR